MHNNYYFLKHLSTALAKPLTGLELATCFSQNKDELVLGFCNPESEFWIKASLVPNLNVLSFPKDFKRSKKNSVDLFSDVLGKQVTGVRQFANERCFGIELGEEMLLFKLFGNRSNILWISDGTVQEVFQNKYQDDFEIDIRQLDRPLDQTFETFEHQGLKATFPTFGRVVKKYLEAQGWKDLSTPAQQWELLQHVLSELETPSFYVCNIEEKIQLLLFEQGEVLAKSTDPIQASNEYYYHFSKSFFLGREKDQIIKILEKKLSNAESYIAKNEAKYGDLRDNSRYEELANILMANIHQIPPRSQEVELLDFYRNEMIKIKLKEKLSPQKNAEILYRKAKNQKIELQKLQENIDRKYSESEALQEHLEEIRGIENVKELRKYLKHHHLETSRTQENQFPFRRFEIEGFDIWIGKNASNNDLLTQKYAYKEDLWLHARDVSGSHVVIKYQAGKKIPDTVIEKAAAIAAYYSQRKNDSLCPVIYTPKKFVRKPKHLPPGAVIVDKEQVILVEPKAYSKI
ncbi:NFACT RNA binding domain-containing protein [Rapidithrix thailandica]|uniref:NFACT RNA binding domain-containing protein n=1 Tax=Rapidithrix thailandica TaxID=413964 RepID=A0AAW9S119_9BACT